MTRLVSMICWMNMRTSDMRTAGYRQKAIRECPFTPTYGRALWNEEVRIKNKIE